MAAQNFALNLSATTTGTAELRKLEEAFTKLIAQADQLGKKSEDSAGKASAAVKRQADQMRGHADAFKNAISNPLDAAKSSVESFVLSYGKVGLVAVAGTAALAAGAAGIYSLANATQELAEQQTNAAGILGLNIRDYGQISQVAKNAGVDAGLLTGTMRGLSKALSDNSDEGKQAKRALADLGLRELASGNAGTKDLLLGIADALGRIENPAARADAAIKILGRSGIGLLPVLNGNLRDTLKTMEALGVGFDDVSANKANKFGDQLDILGTKFDVLKRKIGLASIELINFLNIRTLKTPGEQGAELDAAAQAARDALELRKLRPGQNLTLTPDQLRGGLNLGIGGGQAATGLQTGAKDIVRRLVEEKDTTSRLAAARKDLAAAVQDDDIAGVKLNQARIASLEKQIEAEAKAKALNEKLATFQLPDKLGPNANRSTRVPSLLSGRDRILRGGAIGGDFTVNQGAFDAANSGRQSAEAEQAQARISGEQQRQATAQARNLSVVRQTVDLEIQRLQLVSRTGEEVATINATAALRLAGLEQEVELGRNLKDIELERTRVVQERELAILQIKKQQTEEGRNAATALFDATVAGRGGIAAFFKNQALAPLRTIAGNAGAELGGLTGKLDLGFTGLAGRLTSGTIFGADPLKSATDINTEATRQNTTAVAALSGAFGVSVPGQASASTGGAGGALGTIFGGATSAIGIFNAVRGGGGDISNIAAPIIGSTGAYAPRYDPASGAVLYGGGGTASRTSGLSRGIGAAGIIAGSAFGAYSGFSAGGLQGGLMGSSSVLGGVAGLLPLLGATGPAAPILAGIALGVGGLAALLGDPKKKYAADEERRLNAARYTEGVGREYSTEIGGGSTDYNARGDLRVIRQTVIHFNVSAMDTTDFARRGPDFAQAIGQAINGGQAGEFLQTVQDATR